jgi:hypothetical protein
MYTDNEIDLSLSDATRRYSEVAGRLHKHCYACLIYEQLRCSYSHNYFAGEDVTTVSPTRRQARVSYIGRRIPDPPRYRRMIHFHIGYLVKLAEYHVSVLPPDSESPPVRWWIDGTGTEPSV